MKKIIKVTILSSVLTLLASCSSVARDNPFYPKTPGNDDFSTIGNLVQADLVIDGILDEEEWKNAPFHIVYGETAVVPNRCEAKMHWGPDGLTVGFYTTDKYLASSTEYTNPEFVVNSDNVEFYIDTLNDKGKIAKPDDYTFLINPEGYTEMRTGTGSYWGPWSGVVDYGVSYEGTINDDSDIDVGWGVELFLPYATFGFNKDSTVGVAFGCRNKDSNLTWSDWTGWIPDPQIIDTYVSVNKDGIITDSIKGFDIASGGWRFDEENEEIVSTSVNNLAISQDLEMTGKNGTVGCDMYLGNTLNGDNGIIFQVKPSDSGLFWEGNGARYYFWFINKDGLAMLGSTKNGTWSTLAEAPASYRLNAWNNLKVVVTEGRNIYCFLNGKMMCSYTEALYSTVKVGLRAGSENVRYKNFVCNDQIDITEDIVNIPGYKHAQGEFAFKEGSNSIIYSVAAGSMIYSETDTLTNGTISVQMTPRSNTDNGLIFRLDNQDKLSFWESGVSYYHFFINEAGLAYLGGVNNGSWMNISTKPIPDYDNSKTYELKVVLNGDSIKCYVDDVLYVDVIEATIKGNKYGLRARGGNVEFSLPVVTK